MPLFFHRGSISELKADAVAVPSRSLPDSDAYIAAYAPCRIFRSDSASYVIRMDSHLCKDRAAFESCYRSALILAAEQHCGTVVLPLLYSASLPEALDTAVSVIRPYTDGCDLTVYLALSAPEVHRLAGSYAPELQALLAPPVPAVSASLSQYALRTDDRPKLSPAAGAASRTSVSRKSLFEKPAGGAKKSRAKKQESLPEEPAAPSFRGSAYAVTEDREPEPYAPCFDTGYCLSDSPELEGDLPFGDDDAPARSLAEQIGMLDESFVEMLQRKLTETGITAPHCYKNANISKSLFSRILSTPDYRPKRETAYAIALALKLDLAETAELLSKAGYSMTHSNKTDIILEYCINHRIYNVISVNMILYDYDLPLLGSV